MLDFFKELISSFKSTALERVKSPILGAFVFSWFVFNWRSFLILLFSKSGIEERIIYIEHYYNWLTLYVFPIALALALCWILPWINKAITEIQEEPNNKTTRLLLKAKIGHAKDMLELATVNAKKDLAFKREERDIEENITSLKNDRDNLQSEVYNLQESHRKLSNWFDTESEKTKTLTENLESLNATIEKLNNEKRILTESINIKDTAQEVMKEELSKKDEDIKKYIEEVQNYQLRLNAAVSRHYSITDEYGALFQMNESGELSLVKPEARSILFEANQKAKELQNL
ncbi:TPA: hypothetical protein L9968_000548 [Klebsiella aerogenes]|nr:hypothetical protein [Klebsiella aerogenes]HBS0233151.1 hypothetical protein [Klebsiella aerogenes]HDU3671754.1 hypothetical protein [Klebsiella aerogenes]HDU3694335.1 hypothetical protein [Klebsiella aerogenes]